MTKGRGMGIGFDFEMHLKFSAIDAITRNIPDKINGFYGVWRRHSEGV
jgi:hypothetical protein